VCEPALAFGALSLQERIERSIAPAMQKGAHEGQKAARETAESWGSKDRRTRQERNGGGLYWSTYFATLRREGVFASPSCGNIDMNQELSDPVEEKMMVCRRTIVPAHTQDTPHTTQSQSNHIPPTTGGMG
jgi:hypothetical protein